MTSWPGNTTARTPKVPLASNPGKENQIHFSVSGSGSRLPLTPRRGQRSQTPLLASRPPPCRVGLGASNVNTRPAEQSPPPKKPSTTTAVRPPRTTTGNKTSEKKMCKQFKSKGSCSFGSRCLYHHTDDVEGRVTLSSLSSVLASVSLSSENSEAKRSHSEPYETVRKDDAVGLSNRSLARPRDSDESLSESPIPISHPKQCDSDSLRHFNPASLLSFVFDGSATTPSQIVSQGSHEATFLPPPLSSFSDPVSPPPSVVSEPPEYHHSAGVHPLPSSCSAGDVPVSYALPPFHTTFPLPSSMPIFVPYGGVQAFPYSFPPACGYYTAAMPNIPVPYPMIFPSYGPPAMVFNPLPE